MMKSICLINGHPDSDPAHFCHALCDAYEAAAKAAGHDIFRLSIADLDLPFLKNQSEFAQEPADPMRSAQRAVETSDHVVLVYPLWLGTMPARLKAFLEHLARGNFLLDVGDEATKWPIKKMKGKSARSVVTMGMPGLAYRLVFGAHSLKALEAGVLRISGFKPVRHTIFGMVDSASHRARMLDTMRKLGAGGR